LSGCTSEYKSTRDPFTPMWSARALSLVTNGRGNPVLNGAKIRHI
jgi:hypothetical protein